MHDLAALVQVLKRGGVVACPTETWLGLLADALNEKTVERVAELKGRPADMPIALLPGPRRWPKSLWLIGGRGPDASLARPLTSS
jgi:tRNA A37 threonylcarbamoyladenosine synthetase subunit TsaC/SUA5/YrdC